MNQGKHVKRNAKFSIARVVLVLLFSIAFFSVQSSVVSMKGKSRLVACQFNMKQLGLALDQYAQDSDGSLPPLFDRSTEQMPFAKQTWRETLYPYAKSVGVYRCPNDPYGEGPNTANNLPQSYAANHAEWGKAASSSRVIRLVDVRGDDGPEWDMTSRVYAPVSGWELYARKPQNSLFFYRPSNTLNVLFADGHVKSLPPMNTLTPVNLWTHDNAPFMGQDLSNARAILQHAQDEWERNS